MYDFRIESLSQESAVGPNPSTPEPAVADAPGPVAQEKASMSTSSPADLCPGSIEIPGYSGPAGSRVAVVPTGWLGAGPGAKIGNVEVVDGKTLVPHMDGRAYLADRCTGAYNNSDYLGLNLLSKKMEFMVNLAGAGCGCNAAFYLVSMKQNTEVSTCKDYYCDANHVCGVSCDEIDIMEANEYAFHSTLHTLYDHSGVGGGYGGGSGWNGPRDFTKEQYGPGAKCVDTTKPFKVSVSFPTDGQGQLQSMEVEISQVGSPCPVHISVRNYKGNAKLTESLAQGMTPVLSYWSANDMLWMDGEGSDHRGPCHADDAGACGARVSMYDFKIESLVAEERPAASAPSLPTPAATAAAPTVAPHDGEDVCPGS